MTSDQKAAASAGGPGAGRPLIDGTIYFFIALAVISGFLLLALQGWPALREAAINTISIMTTVAPSIAAGMLLGGLAMQLADPARVAPVLGSQSGWRGLILASGLGMLTPGGPFAAFPIVYAFFLAGADIGAVVAYITAWSVLGLHRVVIWELPLLGMELTVVRLLACLPLPVLAGAVARLIARGRLTVVAPAQMPSGKGR